MTISKKEISRSILWPRDLETRYGISNVTRWRWERQRKLPTRDVFVGGIPEGWNLKTIEAAERGDALAVSEQSAT